MRHQCHSLRTGASLCHPACSSGQTTRQGPPTQHPCAAHFLIRLPPKANDHCKADLSPQLHNANLNTVSQHFGGEADALT